MLPDAECSDCSLKGDVLRDAGISLTLTSLMGCDKLYCRRVESCPLEFVVSDLSSVSSSGGAQDRRLLLFNTFSICDNMVAVKHDGPAFVRPACLLRSFKTNPFKNLFFVLFFIVSYCI